MKYMLSFAIFFSMLNAFASECEVIQKTSTGIVKHEKMFSIDWEKSYSINQNYSFTIRSIQVGIDSFDEFVQIKKDGKELAGCEKQIVFKNEVYWGMRTICGNNLEVICSKD